MWLHMQDLKKDQRLNTLMRILKGRLIDLLLTGWNNSLEKTPI